MLILLLAPYGLKFTPFKASCFGWSFIKVLSFDGLDGRFLGPFVVLVV